MRARLLVAAPEVGTALAQLDTFCAMVRARERSALGPWLQDAAACPVLEIRTFAAGVRRDEAAVAAALAHPWSSGQVEGQVSRLKLVKRQMYGRAKFDLLRRRVLLAS
jgi:transposase